MITLQYYLEMARASDFNSGMMKNKRAKDLVKAFRDGEETYDINPNEKYRMVKKVAGNALEKGMLVMGSYNAYNQGAHLYEIVDIIDRSDKDDSYKKENAYPSVKAMLKAHDVTSLAELEKKETSADDSLRFSLFVKDLADGDSGPWFYLYKGAWVRGSGAEKLTFTQVEKI